MNRFILVLALSSGTMMVNTAFSQPDVRVMRGEDSFWLCKAYDSDNNQWMVKSPYQQVAINQAYDGCKKKSKFPASCQAAKEFCDSYIKGVSTKPMWRCTALDHLASVWESDVYTQRDDAALGAKAYCEQNSGMPDTCYVNLLTCKNMNKPKR